MWLGSLRHSNKSPLGIKWTKDPMKILGIFISYNTAASYEKNTASKLDSIKKIINLWKSRNLSLLGKIQIVKTFLISKLQYYISVECLREDTIKVLNKIILNFIWNGHNDKVKRTVLVQDIENGGLNAPHLESIILTTRIMWLKRYFWGEDSFWKRLFEYNMSLINDNFYLLLYCNYDCHSYKHKLEDKFYIDILHAWNILQAESRASEYLGEQFIWLQRI